MKKFLLSAAIFSAALLLSASGACGQDSSSRKAGAGPVYKMPKTGNFMRYLVQEGDTVYVASIAPAVKYAVGSGKIWRKESRLLNNFGKVYPYALEAKRLMAEVDADLDAGMRKRKKERYINAIQKDLMDKYEPVLRKMTVTQGKLLIKLIGRETGLTPYEIIHDYKSGLSAGTWQGVAKIFGGDLKKRYDPEGEDSLTEYLVRKWNEGQYPALYRSVFGREPDIPKVEPTKVPPKDGKNSSEKGRQTTSRRSPSNTA